MNEAQNLTIALLIDAENISPYLLDSLEEKLTMYGRITTKKCYGDFTKTQMSPWNAEFVNKHSLEVVQQHNFTKGKNASDIRLAIDAMDILYEKTVDTICLMSSDSDFTGLAIRLKQAGIYVWGAGEPKTPDSFKRVCDRFFTLTVSPSKDDTPVADAPKASVPEVAADVPDKKEEILQWVEKLLDESYHDGIDSGMLAAKILQRFPDFDWKVYGVKKFPDFFSSDGKKRFEVRKSKAHTVTIHLK